MQTERLAHEVVVRPWWRDHSFQGRAVLPAVETLAILAEQVQMHYPDVDCRRMRSARFPRFLEIQPGRGTLALEIELERLQDGTVQARLCSRLRLTAMRRLLVHGEVTFGGGYCTERWHSHRRPPRPEALLSSEQVYEHYVPFGRRCHSLKGKLHLANDRAWGHVWALNDLDQGVSSCLGSPFPLDGAMHMACVHGQRKVNYIPFPTGFAERVIHRQTRAGRRYGVDVVEISTNRDKLLVYDLEIRAQDGTPAETVCGLVMQRAG